MNKLFYYKNLIYNRLGRLNVKVKEHSPGPATYGWTDLNAKLPKSPSYGFGRRVKIPCAYNAPSPNTYNIANYKPGKGCSGCGLCFSFGRKHSEYAPPMIVPCDN